MEEISSSLCGLFPNVETVSDMNDQLGIIQKIFEKAKVIMSNPSIQSETRIINGRQVNNFTIPWVVRLGIKKKVDKESVCTGSILTKWFIMTAAHCLCSAGICMEDFSPNVLRDEKRVFAYVGGPEKKSMIRHRAKSAWIHPQYLRNGTSAGAYDIAIIRLYVSIAYSEKVRPICLPTTFADHKPGSKVYTAGWGLRYIQESDAGENTPRSSCITNQIGPDTFAQCREGWKGCNRIDYPPFDGQQCEKWRRPNISDGVDIIQYSGDLNLTCYKNSIGKYGWCHTSPGNWGYCSRSCMMAQTPLDAMEYVELQIVSPQKCDSSIQENLELCVGGLAPRAKVAIYFAQMVGANVENYTFSLKEELPDPRFPEPLIGFKDSCSGDSGSPLWVFQENRAYVVGLTSRGASVCGQIGTPAIYTRVTALKEWIEARLNAADNSASVLMFGILINVVVTLVVVHAH